MNYVVHWRTLEATQNNRAMKGSYYSDPSVGKAFHLVVPLPHRLRSSFRTLFALCSGGGQTAPPKEVARVLAVALGSAIR